MSAQHHSTARDGADHSGGVESSPPGVPESAGGEQEPGAPEVGLSMVVDLEDQLRRAMADLDNLRKRYNREIARERADERAWVVSQWLPVVDDLERALQHAGDQAPPIVEGVRAVLDQAFAVLARLGYTRFDDVGEQFDPMRHEAVGVIHSGGAPGTVVSAVRSGYATDNATLRPAGVIVADRSP